MPPELFGQLAQLKAELLVLNDAAEAEKSAKEYLKLARAQFMVRDMEDALTSLETAMRVPNLPQCLYDPIRELYDEVKADVDRQRAQVEAADAKHDFRAEIEMLLASHKVSARVTGGTVTPRLVRFHLATALGVRVRQVANLSEEIALSLGAPSCRVYRHQGQVEVEVPRERGRVVPLLPLCQRLAREGPGGRHTVPPLTAVLGLDQEGVPLLLRLPSPNVAHALIAGTTGSGKTALARTMVASLALHNSQRNLQLVLVDPKGRGFLPFEGLPHLLVPVVTRVDEALAVLQRLVAEMERRDVEGRCEPGLVVVLDELADLVQVGGREMVTVLTRLTQRGREAGLHLVACTQKPAAAVISPTGTPKRNTLRRNPGRARASLGSSACRIVRFRSL